MPILALLQVVLISGANIAGGYAARRIGAVPSAAGLVLAAAIVLSLCAAALGTPVGMETLDTRAWLGGLTFAAGLLGTIAAIARGNAALVSAITVTTSTLTVVVGEALLSRGLSLTTIAVLVCVMLALWIGTFPSAGSLALPRIAALFAFGSGLFFGLNGLIFSAGQDQAQVQLAASTRVCAVPLLWVVLSVSWTLPRSRSTTASSEVLGRRVWSSVLIVLLAGTLDAAGNTVFMYSISASSLAEASILGSLIPLATVFLGWWVLRERPSVRAFLGGACAVAAVVVQVLW